MARNEAGKNGNGANLGFEAELFKAADKLRGNMDAAEYKHVVLGLIFLKYISDAFEAKRTQRAAGRRRATAAEDRDEYLAENVFWVPKEARWSHLQANAKQPTIGKLIDDAMVAIERDNPSLKGVLPKDYARPALDKSDAGRADRPDLRHRRWASEATARKDILGPRLRVLPRPVRQRRRQARRRVLHAALRGPRAGRDAGAVQGPRLRPVLRLGRHVRAVREVRARPTAGASATSRSTARSRNPTTWRLAKMNLAIRGIDANLGAGTTPTASTTTTCTGPARPISSSPTRRSTSATGAASACARTCAGSTACRRPATPTTPGCSTFIHHLAPNGHGGLRAGQRLDVLQPVRRGRDPQGDASRPIWWTAWWRCRGSSSTPRRSRSACGSWPATRSPARASATGAGEMLFIDARKLGTLVDRTQRELTDEDIAQDRRHLPRLARREGRRASTPTCRASASRHRWRTSASTAMC